MTDKYEQFKEWFKHHPTDEDVIDLVFAIGNLFKEFGEEQAEKEKEKEIKKVLDKYIVKIGFGSIDGDDIEINGDAVDKCYNELKERDLIK